MSNEPLGIGYDYWHFILATIVFLVIALTLTFTTSFEPQIAYISAVLTGFFGTTWLQFAYECYQLYSTEEVSRHGGFHRFIKNSKRDTKLTLWGVVLGSAIYTGIFITLINREVL